MPWDRLVGPIAKAEDALARLDERLRKSPIREGWIARTHFDDACASMWIDGELVHAEDLVLHDAMMDVRTPTSELVRAHGVLRARRRIEKAEAGWSMTAVGLDVLRGRSSATANAGLEGPALEPDEDWDSDGDDEWKKALAAIDTVVARSGKLLVGDPVERRPAEDRPSLVYDLDWDENARLAEWRRFVGETRTLPPTLAASIALDAWNQIEPLQSQNWLGRQLVGDLLRGRDKARSHLPSANAGLKATPQERRWKTDPRTRLEVGLEALAAAADAGLREHDRLLVAHARLTRRVSGRRSSSSLPDLIELVVERPVVTAALIASRLQVTQRAALTLAQELGLRETTGRARYRAWTVS